MRHSTRQGMRCSLGSRKSELTLVTLIAYALAPLAAESDPMLRLALQGAPAALKPEFDRRYGTGCKIALAYALLRLRQTEPFRTFAPPLPGRRCPAQGDREPS